MKIKEITSFLESLAPIPTQEDYDNSGLIVGNHDDEVRGVLISLDCTEDIVDEAIRKNCNMIVSHHPIVFKGLKKLNGKNYVERTVLKAIKHDIALYAIHTNLDNYRFGVNHEIAQRLGLINTRILAPSKNKLIKLSTFVPVEHIENVRTALFSAGAGHIGDYDQCSFSQEGTGTFRPQDNTNPFVGTKNELHKEKEVKLEVILPEYSSGKVLAALHTAHPYEEVAYDLIPLLNENKYMGAGMVGELETPVNTLDYLKQIKADFNCGVIRHTEILKDKVQRIAFCGGSGSFLLPHAVRAGADLFITGDYKYHDFFDSENQIVIADIGHYESEQFTIDLIGDAMKKKFVTFAVHLTELNTNPVNYL